MARDFIQGGVMAIVHVGVTVIVFCHGGRGRMDLTLSPKKEKWGSLMKAQCGDQWEHQG